MSIQSEITRIIDARDEAFEAVKAKGVTVEYGSKIDDLPQYILDIDTQFGDDVIFIDYDGTELYKYKASVVQSMTELPPNPSHPGLVAQGWNWSLAEIKTQLTNVGGKVFVGQMYNTASGATEIDIELLESAKSPWLRFALNGTATVDWGDGSTPSELTGSSLSTNVTEQHAYASGGSYTIKITLSSGSSGSFFMDNNVYRPINGNKSDGNANASYASAITAIRISDSMAIGNNSFRSCYNMKNITIATGITSIGKYAFIGCRSLNAVVLPDSITSIGQESFNTSSSLKCVSIPFGAIAWGSSAFYDCRSLEYITMPSGMTGTLESGSFYDCFALKSIVIPSGITKISGQTFKFCRTLKDVVLPSGLTEISGSAFHTCSALEHIEFPSSMSSIGSAMFQGCGSLKSVTFPTTLSSISYDSMFKECNSLQSFTMPSYIPSIAGSMFYRNYSLHVFNIPTNVTNIAQSAFYECYGMKEYHFASTTPPTLDNVNAFDKIQSYCVMYVPYSADHSVLEAYKTATNWATYADYMQEEPQV